MDRSIDTPNILHNYDYALLVNCSRPGKNYTGYLTALEKVLRTVNQSFLVVLVESESQDELSSLIGKQIGNDPRIKYEVTTSDSHTWLPRVLMPSLNLLERYNCNHFIFVNADGVDHPEAIPKLISTKGKDVVFVDKGPKADHFLFWLLYRFHQSFFWLITGKEIGVDHYSMINRKALRSLLSRPFLHLPTALHLRKLNIGKVRHEHPNLRFGEECRQLFRNSVLSLLEFGEDLLSVFFKFSLWLGFLLFGSLVYAGIVKGFTEAGLPDWYPLAIACIFNGLILNIGLFSLGALFLNRYRQATGNFQLQKLQQRKFTRIIDN